MLQVGHRVGHGPEDLRAFQYGVGAGGRAAGARIGPAVARADQAHLRQAAIQHGARRHADILTELRPHQNDDGRRRLGHAALRGSSHDGAYSAYRAGVKTGRRMKKSSGMTIKVQIVMARKSLR